ncbi:MAG: vWA domain-containing protein [Gammaproteobacteria bacterium]
MQFLHPWLLLLLPLGVLPWLRSGLPPVSLPSLDFLPADRLSQLMSVLFRIAATLALAGLVFALAGPYRPAETETRTGQGAQVILLLDRSSSMDQPFHNDDYANIPGLAQPLANMESKGSVARRVLSDFVAARKNDRFGMLVFSTRPIEVLPLTDKQDMVLAAIQAGNVGRGLAETNIGIGLMRAMGYFEDQPYTGSRIVVLISDGAADLTVGDQSRIKSLLARNRVSLYWIYIRTNNSVGLFNTDDSSSLAPQQEWHRFFEEMETPYRVYTAENPDDLKRAIDDVGRLQNLPILYEDVIPRRDLARPFYLLAVLLLIMLTLARAFEVRAWR